jgi:hypothetical protein
MRGRSHEPGLRISSDSEATGCSPATLASRVAPRGDSSRDGDPRTVLDDVDHVVLAIGHDYLPQIRVVAAPATLTVSILSSS